MTIRMFGFLVLLVIGLVQCDRPTYAPPSTPEEIVAHDRSNQIQANAQRKNELQFQSFVIIAKAVKASMKSPDSFKLDTFTKMESGAVCMTFHATNSFNAIIPGSAVFYSDKLHVEGEKGYSAHWNKMCAGKHGEDFIFVRQALS